MWISRIFLVLSIVLLSIAVCVGGSSSEGAAGKSILYTVSAATLVVIFGVRKLDWISKRQSFLLLLFGGLSIWMILQCLPVGAWLSSGDDRELATTGMAALGQSYDHFSLSFLPEQNLAMLVAMAAPLAAFCLICAAPEKTYLSILVWFISLLGVLSSGLGLAQVSGGAPSWLYLYENTNMGSAVGLFANVNHQACFLLMTLPFAIFLSARAAQKWRSDDAQLAKAIVFGAFALIIALGVLVAGSIAGYGLLLFILGGFVVRFLRIKPSILRYVGMGISLASVIAISLVIVFSPHVLAGFGETNLELANDSRVGMNLTGLEIWQNHWLWGTGPGTIAQVFPLYENTETVGSTFVNQLHNEYLQWGIEMGLPGLTLLLLFLAWLVKRSFALTLSDARYPGVQYSSVISIWVLLLHSFVDYSIRTSPVLVLAAIVLALLTLEMPAEPQRKRRRSKVRYSAGS